MESCGRPVQGSPRRRRSATPRRHRLFVWGICGEGRRPVCPPLGRSLYTYGYRPPTLRLLLPPLDFLPHSLPPPTGLALGGCQPWRGNRIISSLSPKLLSPLQSSRMRSRDPCNRERLWCWVTSGILNTTRATFSGRRCVWREVWICLRPTHPPPPAPPPPGISTGGRTPPLPPCLIFSLILSSTQARPFFNENPGRRLDPIHQLLWAPPTSPPPRRRQSLVGKRDLPLHWHPEVKNRSHSYTI